ncbi:hypothetical protein [Sphingomonas dokdonensis]|uniref:Uncharacterized protein n=1 Tax=Sphingomonas dokdonensis TaxID=344880 RepID=A0A245ZGL8_9SPHN|nr:hypothetical protein [Sphingomonas dokdonensis]OWK28897.1 hypothetical protein SPDO_27330 [Sphingomonas dokdonensis]
MTVPYSSILHIVGAIRVGAALDWAVFERVKITFGPYGDKDEVRYHHLPHWRMVALVLASAMVGASLATQMPVPILFWVGVFSFAALNIYADYIGLKGR